MSELRITTNNVPRLIKCGFELPESQREEFDYLTDEEFECGNFVQYKGDFYWMGEFMKVKNHPNKEFSKWDGYHGQCAFWGILIKLCDDNDYVIMGSYFSA